MYPFFQIAAKSVCSFLLMGVLVSCEDRALVQENEALLKHVAEREAELELLESEAGENPGDQSVELERCSKLLAEAEVQLKELQSAEAKTVAENEQMKWEFQQYRTKYQMK